jgi:hypothetical protein
LLTPARVMLMNSVSFWAGEVARLIVTPSGLSVIAADSWSGVSTHWARITGSLATTSERSRTRACTPIMRAWISLIWVFRST